MIRIATESGRVGHIAGNIFDGPECRIVTTVCGQTHPEYEFHVDTESPACIPCDKKFFELPDEPEDDKPAPKKAVEKPVEKDEETKTEKSS